MKFLTEENVRSWKNYKYQSEDNCFLSNIYKKIWNNLDKFIPRALHPNIITLCGLLSIIICYHMSLLFSQYRYLIMSLGVFLYLNADGIDGIHARNTKQNSIIGEYLDHLFDLVILGFIVNYLYMMFGFGLNNSIKINLIIYFCSFEFFYNHWIASHTKKIIFTGTSDVASLLTLTVITIFSNIKMPLFLINNQWILPLGLSFLFAKNVYHIIKTQRLSLNEIIFKNFYLVYWLLKLVLILINPTNFYWTTTCVDLLLMLETINFKIFSSQIINKDIILLNLLIYSYSNMVGLVFSIGYTLFFIKNISKQLKINLFQNHPSNYLPRVYCCGVFDTCHLGHMKLFEKISKSFDYPVYIIVGVHSDSTVKGYKREPIINEKLRIETVKMCKYVDDVYPDAELVVTKEFCLENNIDCVIIGEEYKDNKDKIWYQGGMELGIHKYISRFDDISTTDIINRIKSY